MPTRPELNRLAFLTSPPLVPELPAPAPQPEYRASLGEKVLLGICFAGFALALLSPHPQETEKA